MNATVCMSTVSSPSLLCHDSNCRESVVTALMMITTMMSKKGFLLYFAEKADHRVNVATEGDSSLHVFYLATNTS